MLLQLKQRRVLTIQLATTLTSDGDGILTSLLKWEKGKYGALAADARMPTSFSPGKMRGRLPACRASVPQKNGKYLMC